VLSLVGSTPQDRAAKELGWLIEKDVRIAVYAMSLLPTENSVPVLTKIAERYHDTTDQYLGQTVGDAIVLLTILGGKESRELLKTLDAAGELRHLSFLDTSFHDYVMRFDKRLSISDSKRQESRREEDLAYWRCSLDLPPGRVIWVMLFQAARRHRECGIHISSDFLRSRFPERYAIAVAGVQDEKALTPELKALAAKDNHTAQQAQRALKMIESATQTRPSGSDTDAR